MRRLPAKTRPAVTISGAILCLTPAGSSCRIHSCVALFSRLVDPLAAHRGLRLIRVEGWIFLYVICSGRR